MTHALPLDLLPRRRFVPGARARVALTAPVVLLPAAAVAVALGAVAAVEPVLALSGVAGVVLVGVVFWRPVAAAYLVIGTTPLLVGIDRDRIFPLLRPNEVVLGLLLGILVTREVLRLRLDARPRIHLDRLTLALLAMAVASSVLPLAFNVMRGRPVEMDDITHAAVLWKYFMVYALVRYTVRTQAQVRVCLWISMLVAGIVGFIAIAQSLGILGVRDLLVPMYTSFDYVEAFADPRAGSTIGLPAATADFIVLNLVLAIGMGWRDRRLAPVLLPLGLVYVMAVFSAAEFSSALGLVIAMVTVAALLRRLDLLRYGILALPVAIWVLWPTVEHRIVEFQSMHGIPRSWLVRWYNLETYFWPELFSGTNPILGVRPSARVPAEGAYGFVWIESGYTWLLWGGGVFLLAAFGWFAWVAFGLMRSRAEGLGSFSAVAALGACVMVVVVVALMVFDPHITYRGFADAFFAAMALALVPHKPGAAPSTAAVLDQEETT